MTEQIFRIMPDIVTYQALKVEAGDARRDVVDEASRRILGMLDIPLEQGRPDTWRRPRALMTRHWLRDGEMVETASIQIVLTQMAYEALVEDAVRNRRPNPWHVEWLLGLSLGTLPRMKDA